LLLVFVSKTKLMAILHWYEIPTFSAISLLWSKIGEIYTRRTKAPKLVKEVFRVDLSILEGVPKIFTSGTPPNWGYNIVPSTPSGENVFPQYFVFFTHNLKFVVKMSL